MTKEEYLQSRVDDQINWYSKKAITNKNYNVLTKALIIIFSTIIPVIAGIEFDLFLKNFILGLIGAFVAILSGISALLKFHEKWIEYRATCESLKHEKILFQTLSGPYTETSDSFKLLVERIEKYITTEHSTWIQFLNKNK